MTTRHQRSPIIFPQARRRGDILACVCRLANSPSSRPAAPFHSIIAVTFPIFYGSLALINSCFQIVWKVCAHHPEWDACLRRCRAGRCGRQHDTTPFVSTQKPAIQKQSLLQEAHNVVRESYQSTRLGSTSGVQHNISRLGDRPAKLGASMYLPLTNASPQAQEQDRR